MLKKMLYPKRAEQMEHRDSGFDECGPSFGVFVNLIQDGIPHPMLQTGLAFTAFAAVFPDLSKLVVDGVAQVENYTANHVVSVPAHNQMPHQANQADPPSEFHRAIIVVAATLSRSENSAFSAPYAEGIIFSKNKLENNAISTAAGNNEITRRTGPSAAQRVPPSRRPRVRHDGRRIRDRWKHRACIASAGCGWSGCRWVPDLICIAHASWVRAHTTQER